MIDTINYTSSILKATMIYDEINSVNAFLIKEDSNIIEMLPEKNLDHQIRSGLIILDDIGLILFMLQAKSNPSTAYQIWLNYFDEDDKKCLIDISAKNTLNIIFFNEEENLTRHFSITNYLQIAYKMFLSDLKRHVPWSSDEFECVKTNLIRKYPSPLKLWIGIQEMSYARKVK